VTGGEGVDWSVVWELENCHGAVLVSCYFNSLVDEAKKGSRTLGKEKVRRWKPLLKTGQETAD
jgi:hypothetical protein